MAKRKAVLLSAQELNIIGAWCDFGFDYAIGIGDMVEAEAFLRMGDLANLQWAENKRAEFEAKKFLRQPE